MMDLRARGRAVVVVAMLSTMFVLGHGAEPVLASSITVNTALDIAPDGNGKFPTDGKCSLRAAIQSAQNNSNASDVDCATGAPVANVLDTITIDPSLAGQTMTLTYAIGGVVQPFDVIYRADNPLEIVGPTTNAADFVISGGNAVRPFLTGFLNLEPGVLTLANLTVANGNGANGMAGAPATNSDGGALFAGSGSHLTFDNVVFRNNTGNRGGAIYAQAPTITNNGGAYTSNTASNGGAVFIEGGPATFNGYAMLLEGNSASSKGGAIASNPGASNPFIHLERSLIKDNTAPTGGVIYIEPLGAPAGTTVDITDSTITGNSSVFASTATTQRFNFERDTFVSTGSLFPGTGGGAIRNSIITGSTTCSFSADVANYVGTRNLVPAFVTAGDCGVTGMDPLGAVTGLSPTLAQNGGPEVQKTYALSAGSNAIDNGSSAYCGIIDARSVARGLDGNGILNNPQAGDCDIGAYEYAKYVVNFVTGTSSVNENAGTVNIPVKLRILDPTEPSLVSPISVGVLNDPTSTATPGALGDFTIAGNAVTFPAGSADGAIANLAVNINQDDVAELFGEIAHLDLQPAAGISVAEPRRHNLSIQDDDQAGVIVNDGGNGTTVSEQTPALADSITVRLQSRPDRQLLNPSAPGDPASYGAPADVQMTVTPDRDCTVSSGGQTGTSASPVTFTIANANWQSGIVLGVNAVDDAYDEDFRDENVPHKCELRFTFDSLDPIYDATQDAYEVTVLDNDVAGVNLVLTTPVSILAEGGADAATYAVSLKSAPDPGKPLPPTPRAPTGVVLTPSAGCTTGAGGGMPMTLFFNQFDYSIPKLVDVRPVDNLVVELIHSCTVTTTITSGDPVYADLDDAPPFAGTPPNINHQIQDYDPPTITNDPPFVDISTGDGVHVDEATPNGFDTVSVVLERAPLGANVSVTLSTANDPIIAGPQLALAPLTGVPGPNVTLVFTPANWNVAQQVEIHAVDDDYDEDDPHPWTFTASVDSTAPGFNDPALRRIVVDGNEVSGTATIPAAIADDDTSAIVPEATGGGSTVAENGATDIVTVRLATHPYADVTVEVTADSQCTVDGGSSTSIPIAAADWNVPVDVVVAAVDDFDLEANPHVCELSMKAISVDTRYHGLTAAHDVDVIDDEVAEVTITSGDGLAVSESGTTDTFDVVLSARPSDDVTVTFGHDGQTASAPSVTFTPLDWNQPRTVTVSAIDDDIDEPSPHSGTITFGVTSTAIRYGTSPIFRVDGNAVGTIDVDVTDDDTAGIAVAPTTLDLHESGPADTYTVVLASEPVADVVVSVSAAGLCTTDVDALTFTPSGWDEPQTVTVTPGDDAIVHAQSCTVTHGSTSDDPLYEALTIATVSGAVADDDVAGVVITAGALTLHEADELASVTYTVVLATQPLADVTISIDTSDGQTVVNPTTLVFTAGDWDTPQTVTVSVVDDALVESTPHDGVVGHSAASSDPAYDTGVGFTVDGLAGSNLVIAIHDNETTTTVEASTFASNRDPVSATATVTGGDAPRTGTVQFALDGTDAGAPVALVNGKASIDLGILAHGSHTITAAYSGDLLHEGSDGAVTVDVVAAPVANDDTLTVAEDSSATSVAVLGNDTDADGDTLTVSKASQGAHGTVQCSATSCAYKPSANYNGVDTFTYTVTDGLLESTASVHVTVTAVNDDPVPGTLAVHVVSGKSVTFNVVTVATDVDGDTLTVSSYSQPAHGTVVCAPTGECTYTPNAGYTGTDSFSYELSDGAVASAVPVPGDAVPQSIVAGTVTITVAAAPAVPTDGGNGGTGGAGGAGGAGGSGGTGGSGDPGSTGGALPRTGTTALPVLLAALTLLGAGVVLHQTASPAWSKRLRRPAPVRVPRQSTSSDSLTPPQKSSASARRRARSLRRNSPIDRLRPR